MLLVSQNIGNYDIAFPNNVIFLINMALCNSISELEEKLEKNKNSYFFIDLPIGRIKPPNNRYTLDEMIPVLEKNDNIKYFAVSNVESSKDLEESFDALLHERSPEFKN